MSTVFGESGPKNVQVLPIYDMAAGPGAHKWRKAYVRRQRDGCCRGGGSLSCPVRGSFGPDMAGGPAAPEFKQQRQHEEGYRQVGFVDSLHQFQADDIAAIRAASGELNINTHVGEFWYLIDAIWMSNWIDFVMGKTGPPGPISNNNLFVEYAGTRRESLLARHAASARSGVMTSRPGLRLKEGLQKVRDYRAVHPLVWYIYREIYAADDAPELCRWKANIYQAEVQATRKCKFGDEMHTKAVYELRRFCAKVKKEMQA